MQCRNHPDRAATAICQKYGKGFCRECCDCVAVEQCCDCLDPKIYCTFRQQCLIWEHSRERRRSAAPGASGG